jgi:hypothetical protein
MGARAIGLGLAALVALASCGGGGWYKRYGIKDEKELGTYRALPGLERALLKGSCYDLMHAGEALQRIGERAHTIQEAMQRAVARSECRMAHRRVLAAALGALGARGVDFLEGLAGAGDADSRTLGIVGLGRMTGLPARVVPTLAARVASADPLDAKGARLAAVEALAGFGPAAAPALPALVGLLAVEDYQEAAVQSLGGIGLAEPRVLEALRSLAGGLKPGDALRALAVEQLEKLAPGSAADLAPAPVKSL